MHNLNREHTYVDTGSSLLALGLYHTLQNRKGAPRSESVANFETLLVFSNSSTTPQVHLERTTAKSTFLASVCGVEYPQGKMAWIRDGQTPQSLAGTPLIQTGSAFPVL